MLLNIPKYEIYRMKLNLIKIKPTKGDAMMKEKR